MQFVRYLIPENSLFLILTAILVLTVHTFGQRDDVSLLRDTEANVASDDLTGEDLRIRNAAVEALGNRAGTIVVMSAQSGQIFTIVNQDWAIRRGFKPCSTIKLVTAIAGFNEKLIELRGNLAAGSYRLGLDDSLAYSNNTYFQMVGSGLGSAKMIDYARMLGLGSRTGINAPGEYVGRLPYGNENLRIYSHADDFEVTPLQLAVMVSAITNGGHLVIPQIPKTEYAKVNFRGYYRDSLDLKQSVYERVIPGMIGAVNYGTAKRTGSPNLRIAGKTGSCISDGTWVGLFASAAPVQDPRFTVIVITEGTRARGKAAAQIAGKVYQSLSGRFNNSLKGNLARKTIVVGSQSETNSATLKRTGSSEPVNKPVSRLSSKISENHPANTNSKKDSKPLRTESKASKKKPEEMFPTIVIKGKSEISRPRIVNN